MSSSSIFADDQATDNKGGIMPPWRETLEEWLACAGLGIIPLLCTLATAYLTENKEFEQTLLQADHLYRELILFCIVTNTASVVVFVSKFNLLQVVSPSSRRLPTGLFFLVILVTIACAFVYVVLSAYNRPALYPMLSCLITTLLFSIWSERRIGVIARE
jgi:hypothetical protein